ncbi:MAG: acylphosphatase [Patescibacteria group bacterium]
MINQQKIIFLGRVQGIGFRYTALKLARELNLKGYVKNFADSSVELVAQGDEKIISNLVEKLRDSFSSEIENVKIIDQKPKSKFKDFQIEF